MIERFSFLLKNAMVSYGVGEVRLEEMLLNKGITNITQRRISEYLRNVSTPPFKKAKQIMETLGYPIDDEMLEKSLEWNRDLIRGEKEMLEGDGYAKSFSVNIKYRKIGSFKTSIEAQTLLNERIRKLYGDSEGNLTKYVEQLIATDLKQYSIEKER